MSRQALHTFGAELYELPLQLFNLEDYVWYHALLLGKCSMWLRRLAASMGRLLYALDEVIDLCRQRLLHCACTACLGTLHFVQRHPFLTLL